MREPLRDQLRLLHILEACDRIISYYPNNEIPLLNPKSIEFFGLVKNLEIIGEAAYMLSQEFVSRHPATSWNDIVRMRHLLVHGYYHISPEIVKEIAETDIDNGCVLSQDSRLGPRSDFGDDISSRGIEDGPGNHR